MPDLPSMSPEAKSRMIAEVAIGTSDCSYWTFRADDRLYGIDVASLREISTNTSITPVPHAPPAIRGLTNLRSRILLVLDLRPLLGLPAVELTTESRLVILKSTVIEDVGILVDRGGDIVRVTPDQMESVEQSEQRLTVDHRSLVTGVCKLDQELMMIVDARRIATTLSEVMQ